MEIINTDQEGISNVIVNDKSMEQVQEEEINNNEQIENSISNNNHNNNHFFEEEQRDKEIELKEEQDKLTLPQLKTKKWKDEFNNLFSKVFKETSDSSSSSTAFGELNFDLLKSIDFLNHEKLKVFGVQDNSLTTVRGVLWRIWLGVLDKSQPDKWKETTNKQRSRYDNLKKSYIVDPRGEEKKKTFDDPLSTDKNSIWNQFFENENTQKEIGHDITRTYPGIGFFERLDIQDSMTRILFIFSKQYPKIKYIQGMNEIIAPLLYIAYRDSHWHDDRDVYFNEDSGMLAPLRTTSSSHQVPQDSIPMPYQLDQEEKVDGLVVDQEEEKKSNIEKLGGFLRNSEYFEHDAYAMFEILMNLIGKWFTSPPNKELPPPRVSGKYKELYDQSEKEANQQTVNIVVVDECSKMFADIQYIEPQFYHYLKDLSIDPHLYALRWIRILLAQVFPLSSLLCIWDVLFRENIQILNYICISMLVSIKDSILGRDYSECMQILFHYPIHIQDTQTLIENAIILRDRINVAKKEQGGQSLLPDKQHQQQQPSPTPIRPRVYPSSFTQSIPSPTINNNITTSNGISSTNSLNSSNNSSNQSPITVNSNNNIGNSSDSWSTGGLLSTLSTTVSSTIKSIITTLNDDGYPPITSSNNKGGDESTQQHISKRLERLVYTLETIRTTENSETIQSVQDELRSIRNLILPTPLPTTTSGARPITPKITNNNVQSNNQIPKPQQPQTQSQPQPQQQPQPQPTPNIYSKPQPKVQQLVNLSFPTIEFNDDDIKEVKTEYSTLENSEDEDELDQIQQEINFMSMISGNLGFKNKLPKKDNIFDF